jgi:predicted dinucleotide-utilizing enzyme
VDLVIAGSDRRALAAAADALGRGRRVLVLLRDRDPRVGRRLRRRLHAVASVHGAQLVVATGAQVVCVDGVNGVEVVVVRHTRTGRLSAVNASAFHDGGNATEPCRRRPSAAQRSQNGGGSTPSARR